MSGVSIGDSADWLREPALQRLLAALSAGGEAARVAGGAVRNALLGEAVSDVDVATTTVPDETERRAAAAGFRTVPTGKAHGTITVIDGGRAYEVTTLRADVETDGRHAKVVFGRDWQRDAERRDFTINALYAQADGTVVDPVGGLADLRSRTLRFIGDADARIREDHLRILRFFRFFAWYGDGRPDADGIRACARHKGELARLSAERIWAELRKLMAAPDPSRALLWMRQTSVLTAVLPESEKWGIDAIHGLVAAERDLGWAVDPLLRIAAIVPPDGERMAALGARLKLSNADADRLVNWAEAGAVAPTTGDAAMRKMIYRGNAEALKDRVSLALAAARARATADDQALIEAGGHARLLRLIETWQVPSLPISGGNLLALGVQPGPEVGRLLGRLEDAFVDSDFRLDRDALIKRAAELAGQAE